MRRRSNASLLRARSGDMESALTRLMERARSYAAYQVGDNERQQLRWLCEAARDYAAAVRRLARTRNA